MEFQQIRNASVRITAGGVSFLIDPWLSDMADEEEIRQALSIRKFIPKPVVPLSMPAQEILKETDYILVTHYHPDHFSADYLPKDAPMFFQNRTDAEKAAALGFTDTGWFESVRMQFGNVTVFRTGGRHGDSDELAEHAGPVSGFVFCTEGEPVLYLAGDTVFCPEVEDALKQYRPDITVVNACDARTSRGSLIMNADDVMQVCRVFGGTVIASHMDSVSHAHLSRTQLKQILEENGYDRQIQIPSDDEIIRF